MPLPEPQGVLERLIFEVCKLPGIGPKSAERIAHYLLGAEAESVHSLADAIKRVKDSLHLCQQCYHVTEHELCAVCNDARRDQGLVCVVEQSKDLMAIERSAAYRGVYHVLRGRLAPLDNMGPEKLTIDPLLRRIKEGKIRELIMATNPTIEGDGTALYISNLLANSSLPITRLARGLATGLSLEFANKDVLADALEGRKSF